MDGRTELETVKALLARICDVPQAAIRDEAQLVDYGLDSVRGLDFVMDVEQAFAVEITDDQAAHFRTVADVVRYVRRERLG